MKCLTTQLNGKQCLREGTYSDGKCGYHTQTLIKKVTSKPKTISINFPSRGTLKD
jgi:hypothetical protein